MTELTRGTESQGWQRGDYPAQTEDEPRGATHGGGGWRTHLSQPEREAGEKGRPLMAVLIQIKVKCLWEVEGALRPVTP